MLWRLWHWLFGWDYIVWTGPGFIAVSRVFNDGDGRTYYWVSRSACLTHEITAAKDVIWLTCKPSKYLKYLSI